MSDRKPSRTQENQSPRSRTQWAGAGLAIMAGVGATVGLVLAGGEGLALGAAFGAALGLVLGSAVDTWLQRR